ncbi:hypothetical protein GGF32_010084 [Allomyces javanicus]|nr:hypothetical protein GGF32_010084 [Allomyces javanicus]
MADNLSHVQPATKVGGVRHKPAHHHNDANPSTNAPQASGDAHGGDAQDDKHQQQKTWDNAPAHVAHEAAPPRQNKGELGKTYPLFQPR